MMSDYLYNMRPDVYLTAVLLPIGTADWYLMSADSTGSTDVGMAAMVSGITAAGMVDQYDADPMVPGTASVSVYPAASGIVWSVVESTATDPYRIGRDKAFAVVATVLPIQLAQMLTDHDEMPGQLVPAR